MSKVVFLGFPGHGHINPTLPVVAELVRRGEQVTYYAIEDFRPAIERTGATFHSYGQGLPLEPPDSDKPLQVVQQLMETGQFILGRILPDVKALQPDYLVHDSMSAWGSYLGQILGIPTVSSVPGILTNARLMFSNPVDLLTMLRMQLGGRAYITRAQAIATQLSRKYPIRKPGIMDVFFSPGQLNIVYTSKAFQPFADTFDEQSYKFVGPCLISRPETPTFPFERLQDKPLLYVSLGTAFNKCPDFYRQCFDAFASSDFQVVVAIGRQVSREALGTIPPNFIVEAFVPQLELLQRARLFISHGGMNSVSEALYYNVPLIVIPQGADQPWIARRVADLGAGKMLSNKQTSVQRLRHLAQEILAQPAYAQAAAHIGESLRTAGGYQKAADVIEAFKRSHHLV